MKRAFAYSLTLSQVGPTSDPDFVRAPQEVKDEVKRWVVVYGLKEKDHELAAGLDVHGRPLAPITEATRKYRESAMGPADPNAPPLMPAYGVSRTRLLLEGEPTKDGAQFWWGYDQHTGEEWGQILDYQRQGVGKRKTKRDVIGISPDSVARVREQVWTRWQAWKRSGLRQGWAPERPKVATAPIKLQVTGRTDYQNFTFGIGTSGAPGPGWQATGFSQRRPGSGWTAFGGPNGGGPGRPYETPPPIGPGNPWWNGSPTRPKPRPPAAPVAKPLPKPAAPPKPLPPLTPMAPLAFTPPPVTLPPVLPPPASSPAKRVSEALDVKTAKLAMPINSTLKAIDEVHGDGVLPKIPVQRMSTKNVHGVYQHTIEHTAQGRVDKALFIAISDQGPNPRLTMAHEAGHFLEYEAIPGRSDDGWRDWQADPLMAEWRAAVLQSDAVQSLKELRRTPTVTVDNLVYQIPKSHLNYLLQDNELWARSYAQYVATRTTDTEVRRELETKLAEIEAEDVKLRSQWTPEDFGPVAAAIDKLFAGLGWRE